MNLLDYYNTMANNNLEKTANANPAMRLRNLKKKALELLKQKKGKVGTSTVEEIGQMREGSLQGLLGQKSIAKVKAKKGFLGSPVAPSTPKDIDKVAHNLMKLAANVNKIGVEKTSAARLTKFLAKTVAPGKTVKQIANAGDKSSRGLSRAKDKFISKNNLGTFFGGKGGAKLPGQQVKGTYESARSFSKHGPKAPLPGRIGR
jgi:hypothetical protein